MLWRRIYFVQYRFSSFKARHGFAAASLVLFLFIGVSFFWIPTLQDALDIYFSTDDELDRLRSLFLTLGGALIGASAIVFALVMFAMQINIERMPHGLFRSLSSDRRLLGAFSGAILVAIAVTTLSVNPERVWLAAAVLGAVWGTIVIVFLFLYAYWRALTLINPLQQLSLLVKDVRREMRAWERRERRAAPLLRDADAAHIEQTLPRQSTHDLTRAAYFKLNPHWTDGPRRAIKHAMSFARRYAEQGDHEVSGLALSTVVAINAEYVATKGKTFFGTPPIGDNPYCTDEFINETLEHLRQNVRAGISRGDEQQIEQTLRAMARLIQVYLGIDYSDELVSKTHPHLAARYLSDAVQSVVPHSMPDVLMEGVRLMGTSAQHFLRYAKPNDIASLTEKIAVIAGVGFAKEDYRPVTQAGVEQLARLTINLLQTKDPELHIAADRLRENVAFVAKFVLAVPDTPLVSSHSTYLAPYYSCTTTQTLPGWLTELVNAIGKAGSDDEAARTVVESIEQWAEHLYRTEKELFLAAIDKRSEFALDMVFWITDVTKLLLAVSKAPACDSRSRDNLQKHALRLICVFSWIPEDEGKIGFVGNYKIEEHLFGVARHAYNLGCTDALSEITDLILSWAFKAGQFRPAGRIFERSLCGLAVLAVEKGDSQKWSRLETGISNCLAKDNAPDRSIRDCVARNIRRRAAALYHDDFIVSGIEYAMTQADRTTLQPLLERIANLLSPDTAAEPVNPGVF